jgi:serine/threonine-protein kinase
VGRDGRVRVTDFGLARLSPPAERTAEEPPPAASPLATRMTQTGTLLGTPAYMSPEQLAGQPADARSDVFSYCVALHEALHGVRPFTGASVAELADAIERGDVRRSESAISAPEWLRRTVERGLKARPEERPPSMRALLDALAGPPVAEPAPSASRGRRAGTLLLALGLAAGAVAMIAHRSGPTGATASAPTAITGLPRPASSRPDAVDAYERALTKLRDGRWAGPDLTLATSLDPGLAAAHLRYALQYFLLDPVGAREHLARAVAERGRLDGHDQWLLRAAQAWMQDQPADPASFARVAAEAAERYPLDAELAFYAAMARSADHDDAGAIAGYDRALALDPSFGFAYAQKAELLAYRGDIEGARSVLDQCTRDAPSATMCTEKRTLLDSRDGRCDRVEHDAQRLVASDPSEDTPYWIAALAGYAQGRPTTVVRELLDEYERHATPAAQGRYALADRWRLAVLGGDFDSAIESAARYQTLVASSIDRRLHAYPALYRASALVESGRLAEAAQVAADFLGRQDAWVAEATSDDYAMLRDPTPRLLLIERRAGLITGAEFETRRAAWLATWERSTVPSSRPFLWLHAYATAVETSQDAERALAELPAFGSVPTFTPYFPGDAYVGTTYLRAGHVAEALPYLERAAHGCGALESPIEHTRAQLALGEALASNGRHDEACAAWNVVRSRWGMARPRSVTAEDARARAAAEGCPP